MALLQSGLITRSLEDFFSWIHNRDLALPELQRPSVWSESKIPRLLSSVYEDYPFGIMLIWTPRREEQIRCRPFGITEHEKYDRERRASHYLIDGQQRLTAFFKTLHGLPDTSVRIVFNVVTEEFQLANPRYTERDGWRPLGQLLTLNERERVDFRDRHPDIDDQLAHVFEKLQRLNPKQIHITFHNVQDKSYHDVAEIFERINLGTPVRKSQIVLGKLSTVRPGVVEQIEKYLEEMKVHHGNDFDLDLVMSTLCVTATSSANVEDLLDKYLIQRNGKPAALPTAADDIDRDIETAKRAMKEVFDFVDKYLHIDSMRYFPSERTLSCLALLARQCPECLTDERRASKVALWTAWALLSRRHADQRDLRADTRTIRTETVAVEDELLKHYRHIDVQQRLASLNDVESPIDRNNVLFAFLYSAIRSRKAVSFITTKFEICVTGDPKTPLHEHHIYPAAQIDRERTPDGGKWREEWKDDIGNLTFLLADDNERLKDPDISYLLRYKDVLPGHLLKPKRYGSGDYFRFLRDRRREIRAAVEELIDDLKKSAGCSARRVAVGPEPGDVLDKTARTPNPSTQDPAASPASRGFMTRWEKRCGSAAVSAWNRFVAAVKSSDVAEFGVGNYPKGAPYIYLASSPVGSIPILRLDDAIARVRDKLERHVWNSSPRLAEARRKFRQALIDRVPGAERRGKADRVSAPVVAVADQLEAVVNAVEELVVELSMK